MLSLALTWVPIILGAVFIITCWKLILRLLGIVIIPDDQIGVVNKKFVLLGKHKTLSDGQIVALNGEAGLQADTLAPGIHFWLWPWQYEIMRQKFVYIKTGNVGVVEAQGGSAISNGRILAKAVDCNSYQDVRAFINNGGERGPQISVIPPGSYRINTGFFTISIYDALDIPENMVGIVTTQDGIPLKTGEIAGKEIPNHNNFQDGEAFIRNGGFKGLQEAVLLAGRYYLNPLFATVEVVKMTEVPIANAGVIISYVGDTGVDVTGDSFKHGNLVSKGQKGVCIEPLDPGKYPVNPYVTKVEAVPTANIVLNWATGKTESHQLDKNLSTITVRSRDGFTFNLDVSQIIHIPRSEAPKVIARFGNVANLVTQVLEPTIGNYFRNSAQNSDVIEFLTNRQERQADARERISKALQEYNVVAVDTLIGDIVPPDELMRTLTDRKIAEQERMTYSIQMEAQKTRQQLEQETAKANTQASVVTAERSVEIAEYNAKASVKSSEGEAKAKTIQAEADAKVKTVQAEADAIVFRTVGEAEAAKIQAIGSAEADVTKRKIESMGDDNFAMIQVAKYLAENKVQLVPQIMVGGSGNGANGNGITDVLLANMLQKDIDKKTK